MLAGSPHEACEFAGHGDGGDLSGRPPVREAVIGFEEPVLGLPGVGDHMRRRSHMLARRVIGEEWRDGLLPDA